jgi:hypothetical protein
MKNVRTVSLTLMVMMMAACASKERFDSARAINEECQLEMQAARTAVRLRNQGKPKSELLAPLPALAENSSRLLVNLHMIVYETYQYPDLNEMIYPTYRFDLCLRTLQHKPSPDSVTLLIPDLLQCQAQFGLESSEQSTQCVSTVIDTHLALPMVETPAHLPSQ